MREAELVRKMKKLRCEYDGVVQEMIWQVERRGKARKELRRKEDWIQIKIERIRGKLANLNPKKWAFGAKKTKTHHTYNPNSDNGYIICGQCMGLFGYSYKDKRTSQRSEFVSCNEHRGLCKCGVMQVNEELMRSKTAPEVTEYGKRIGIERIFKN